MYDIVHISNWNRGLNFEGAIQISMATEFITCCQASSFMINIDACTMSCTCTYTITFHANMH